MTCPGPTRAAGRNFMGKRALCKNCRHKDRAGFLDNPVRHTRAARMR
jgi:hypothetical protein